MYWLFHSLIVVHVAAGAIGLVAFWGPVLARKGSAAHRRWGRVFATSLLTAGVLAIGMALCTIIAPRETHPRIPDLAMVEGLFGWLMLYLGVITVTMTHYGIMSVRNKRRHADNRHWLNITMPMLTIVTAANSAWQGLRIGQPIMIGVAVPGLVAAGFFLAFIFRRDPAPDDYLREHLRAMLGAGISVYTAFLSTGAVQIMPAHAFNPYMWAVPSIVGIMLILHHQNEITRAGLRRTSTRETAGSRPSDIHPNQSRASPETGTAAMN